MERSQTNKFYRKRPINRTNSWPNFLCKKKKKKDTFLMQISRGPVINPWGGFLASKPKF